MGWWDDQVVPRATHRLLDLAAVHKLRARACEGLAGEVVEIGFGSGLNLRHYPAEVTAVDAIEPSDVAWRLARDNVGRAAFPVTRNGLDGQHLPLDDHSCDAALSTFTMCTIPDVDAALAELVRVLRPGGAVHFVEHGLAPDPGVAAWQHRLQPIQGRVAGGCHLDRPIADIVERSGMTVQRLDAFYGLGPKVIGYFYLGVATTPTS